MASKFDSNNLYIDEMNENDNNNHIDLDTGSWANIVDTEISGHIENKLLSSNSYDSKTKNNDQTSSGPLHNITDIISKFPSSVSDTTLLEQQTYISAHLKKYIKQCSEVKDAKFDYNLHIPKFLWLAKASKYLSDKLKLPSIDHKINTVDFDRGSIPRSSYKFCEYNYDCQFNYKDKYNGCFAQHFVHNLVYADIMAIIQYIEYINDNSLAFNYVELSKCITTVSYVVKHMSEELSNLQFHYGNIDMIHSEKSQVKKEKRKKPKQKSKN